MTDEINQYYIDNANFPGAGSCSTTACGPYVNCSICQNNNWWQDPNDIWHILQQPPYDFTLPLDPINSGKYNYMYDSWQPSTEFIVCANLENTNCPFNDGVITGFDSAVYGYNCCMRGGLHPYQY